MRTEADISRYRDILIDGRESAKVDFASALPESKEYTNAISLFFRCDGAVQILNWVLGLDTDADFNLPPINGQATEAP